VKETLNGVEITDPYRWLEDQESPKTRAWIEAQNKYTQAQLANLPGRAELTKRLSELMKIDSVSMPTIAATGTSSPGSGRIRSCSCSACARVRAARTRS
jgi:protease II